MVVPPGLVESMGGREYGSEVLPALPALRELLPAGGLRPGSVTAVDDPALLLALAASPTAAGSWVSLVGMPECGLVAAAELGVDTDRLLLVEEPGQRWGEVVAALLDGVQLVAVKPAGQPAPAMSRRLLALARKYGSALLVAGQWPGADLNLRVERAGWVGVGAGHGYLRGRLVEVVGSGRGSAHRVGPTQLWLPSADGTVSRAARPVAVTTPLPRQLAPIEAIA